MRAELVKRCEGKRVRHLVLTRRSDDASLSDALNHLYRSFGKLRESRLWRRSVTGGAAAVEITTGSQGNRWHVHLHCLLVGSYLSQKELSAAWHRASGGSFIVHLTEVKDHEKGIGYICKYVTKGFDRSVLANADSLAECICALRGRRMLVTFGSWHGDDLELERDDPGDWHRVDRLTVIVSEARSGAQWALAVLTSLNAKFLADQVKSGDG